MIAAVFANPPLTKPGLYFMYLNMCAGDKALPKHSFMGTNGSIMEITLVLVEGRLQVAEADLSGIWNIKVSIRACID